MSEQMGDHTDIDMSRAPNADVAGARSESVTLRSLDASVDEKKTDRNEKDAKDVDGREVASTKEGDQDGAATEDADGRYLKGPKLILVLVGMMLSVFLVTLDQTIVATAIPKIASDFDALEQVTWIASAYFLTQAGFILTYGQLLALFNLKWIYLIAIVIFEVGSAICGAATSMDMLIFGRAFAGVGASGIFISVLAVFAIITPLEKRAILFGLFGAIFALSSVVGPLLGGAFTDHVSWRWCFYINLPFGAITVASIVFFIRRAHTVPPVQQEGPAWKKIMKVDWIGAFLCLGMVTCLLLALQWGGVTKPWNSGAVIGCFVAFGVLLPVFILWEWHRGEHAIMPLTMWANRTQIGCSLEAFFIMLVMLCCIYYLPLFYESSEGKSATSSGIAIVIFMVCIVVSAMGSGAVINKTGRPLPWLLVSPLLSAVGCGLVFWNLTNSPSTSKLYGFQVLLGLGIGAALQNTLIVIQAEFSDRPKLLSRATALVSFTQLTGGILGISIAGTIFGNRLESSIYKYAPDLSSSTIQAVRQSVDVIKTLQGQDRTNVIHAYSEALGYVFILGIPAALLASVSATFIKNHNLKEMNVELGAATAV